MIPFAVERCARPPGRIIPMISSRFPSCFSLSLPFPPFPFAYYIIAYGEIRRTSTPCSRSESPKPSIGRRSLPRRTRRWRPRGSRPSVPRARSTSLPSRRPRRGGPGVGSDRCNDRARTDVIVFRSFSRFSFNHSFAIAPRSRLISTSFAIFFSFRGWASCRKRGRRNEQDRIIAKGNTTNEKKRRGSGGVLPPPPSSSSPSS